MKTLRILPLMCLIVAAAGPATAQEVVTLDQCLSAALQSHSALDQAQTAIDAAEARKNQARGHWGPSVVLDANVTIWDKATEVSFTSGGSGIDLTQIPAPSTPYEMIIYGMLQGFSTPTKVQDQVTGRITLSIVQPITPLWTVYKANELATLGIDVARMQKADTEQKVAFGVVTSYIGVLQAESVLRTIDESVIRITEQLDRLRKLQAQELVAPGDVLQVEVALAQAQQAQLAMRNTVSLARAALAVQVGWGISRPVTAAPLSVRMPSLPPASLEELCRQAEAQRVELQMVNAGLAQVDLARDMLYQDFVPSVAVLGSYVHSEGSSFQEPDSWFVGINVSWTLWEWGSSYYKFDENDAARRQVEAGYRQARDYVFLEVNKAFLDLSSALLELEAAKRSIDLAKENYRIQQAMFDADYATLTDLLDAEAALRQAESQYQVVFWKAVLARADLARAQGLPVSSWVENSTGSAL